MKYEEIYELEFKKLVHEAPAYVEREYRMVKGIRDLNAEMSGSAVGDRIARAYEERAASQQCVSYSNGAGIPPMPHPHQLQG